MFCLEIIYEWFLTNFHNQKDILFLMNTYFYYYIYLKQSLVCSCIYQKQSILTLQMSDVFSLKHCHEEVNFVYSKC